jgi:hypothetical protein
MTRKLLFAAWVIVCVALVGSVANAKSDGRWKDDGNGGCVFDQTDTGPDQCSPTPPAGRFKDDGNGGCVFDATDSGPDQCVPPAAPSGGSDVPTITSLDAGTTSTPPLRK